MRLSSIAFTSVIAFAACGKSKPPAPASAPDAAAPAPAPSAQPETRPTEADAAAPVATKPAELDAATKPAEAEVEVVAPIAGDDLVLWTDTPTVRQSAWLHGDQVLATRLEAVTVSDGKLWALGERWRIVKAYGCGEDMEADRSHAPEQVPVPTLVAKELGGATEVVLAQGFAAADDTFDGDLQAPSIGLDGSIGGAVFQSSSAGYFACGSAHPYGDASRGVFDLATRETREVAASDALKAKVAAALKEAAKCTGEEELIDPMPPESLALRFGEGRAQARWVAVYKAFEAARACNTDVGGELPLDATLGLGPVDQRVAKTIATRPGSGAFGFASVPAAQRDPLLELFQKEPLTFQPKPAVAPVVAGEETAATLVAKDRKLTTAKHFAGAIAAFDAAIAKDPGAASAYSGRGYAKLRAHDATAKADFQKALELETKDVGCQAAVWFNLGLIAEGDKDLAGAKAAYEKSSALKPNGAVNKALERVSK